MNFPHKKVMPRYFFWTMLFTIAGVAVVLKAFCTMTVGKEDAKNMSSTLVRLGRELPAKRGNILAADGRILATSLPEYLVSVDFMSVEKDSLMRAKDQERRDSILVTFMDSITTGVHAIFPDIDPKKLEKYLLEGRKQEDHSWPLYVKEVSSLKLRNKENKRISYQDMCKLRKLPLFRLRSSVNYQKVEMRRRPYGNMAVRTIGHFFEEKPIYGLELTFDSILAGKPGIYHLRKVMNYKVQEIDRPAVDGCDIVTTIDIDLQQLCENTLKEHMREAKAQNGTCILMEVETGDIKAMTSQLLQPNGNYFESRPIAVSDLYQPGSVFKPQSFLVGLDDGLIKITDKVDTGNGRHKFGSYTMIDHNVSSGGYQTIAVPKIIGCSSNIGVSVLIDNAYSDHIDDFVDGIYRIGSAEDLKIPLTEYRKPRVRYPGRTYNGRLYYRASSTLPLLSIGYETEFTPINTLNFYNGIANNGRLLRPRLVKAVMKDGKLVKEYPVEVLREQMAKPEAIRNIRTCLEYVTTLGVGKQAGSKMVSTAGKTGTAQVWGAKGRTGDYFVTFAGYFPADKPKYSCIVCMLKTGSGSGGGMCGPVFKTIAETVMARTKVADFSAARDTTRSAVPAACNGDIEATQRLLNAVGSPATPPASPKSKWGTAQSNEQSVTFTPQTEEDGVMPDVEGYGLRDAVNRLEQLGLSVRTTGVGRVVQQSIGAGKKFKPGQVVVLTLETKQRKKKS